MSRFTLTLLIIVLIIAVFLLVIDPLMDIFNEIADTLKEIGK